MTANAPVVIPADIDNRACGKESVIEFTAFVRWREHERRLRQTFEIPCHEAMGSKGECAVACKIDMFHHALGSSAPGRTLSAGAFGVAAMALSSSAVCLSHIDGGRRPAGLASWRYH